MPPARRCRPFADLARVALLLLLGAALPPRTLDAQPAPDDVPHGPVDEDAPLPIERVVRFSIRDGDLAVGSDLPVGEGQRQIQLIGLEGNTRVSITRQPRGPFGLMPYLDLTHAGPALPDGSGTLNVRIRAQGTAVEVQREATVDGVRTFVELTQDRFSRRGRGGFAVQPRGERVRLRVTAAGDEVRLTTDSFAELLRKHPGPVARYLAPAFRDVKQDGAIFRVDPRLAWQVFPNAVGPDAATSSKVMSLVGRLDADDFRVRELATVELEVIGGPALIVLGEVDRAALSAEQNVRVDAILTRHAQLDEAEVAALQADPEFMLRCFAYSDLPPIRAAAVRDLSRLAPEAAAAVPLDPRAAQPERVRAADAFRDRLPAP